MSINAGRLYFGGAISSTIPPTRLAIFNFGLSDCIIWVALHVGHKILFFLQLAILSMQGVANTKCVGKCALNTAHTQSYIIPFLSPLDEIICSQFTTTTTTDVCMAGFRLEVICNGVYFEFNWMTTASACEYIQC